MLRQKGRSGLMASYFTAYDRDCVLQWLIVESQKEPAFVGSILVGSGAVGFADGYSDLDILMIVDDPVDLAQVSERWRNRLRDHLPVLAYAESPRAERIILHNFLLENFLELNICVQPQSLLSATRANYRVLWDKTNRMQSIMDETWAGRKETTSPLARYYSDRKASIWHYINHAYVALKRDRLWQALSDIEEIRRQVIHLRAYREELEPKRNCDVDTMDEEFRKKLSLLLVGSLSSETLKQKLDIAARMFFEEARSVSRHLAIPYDIEALETAMLRLLAEDPSAQGAAHEGGAG